MTFQRFLIFNYLICYTSINIENMEDSNSSHHFPFCSSLLIDRFDRNTTFPEALTPCLSFILFPLLQICSSLPCFLFLIIYGYLVQSPKLALTRKLRAKLFLSSIVVVSSMVHVLIVYYDKLPENREIIIGNFLDLVSVISLFLAEFWRWRKGILSSIWVHFGWTTRFCFAVCQMVFVDYNTVSF